MSSSARPEIKIPDMVTADADRGQTSLHEPHPEADKVGQGLADEPAGEPASALDHQEEGDMLDDSSSLSGDMEEEAPEDEEDSVSLRTGEGPAGDLSDPRPPTAFLEELRSFFAARGATLQVPRFNKRELDVEKLWLLAHVQGGGYDLVCQKKLWASVGRHFNPPKSMTNLSFHMKRLYERLLLPFERVWLARGRKARTSSTAGTYAAHGSPSIKRQRPAGEGGEAAGGSIPPAGATPLPQLPPQGGSGTGRESGGQPQGSQPSQQLEQLPGAAPQQQDVQQAAAHHHHQQQQQQPQGSAPGASRPQRSTRGKRSTGHFGDEFLYESPTFNHHGRQNHGLLLAEARLADAVTTRPHWVPGRDVRLEGEELVGYHLETWDKESNCYRKGLVVAFNPSQGLHSVRREDGGRDELLLAGDGWRLCPDDDSDAMAVQQLAELAASLQPEEEDAAGARNLAEGGRQLPQGVEVMAGADGRPAGRKRQRKRTVNGNTNSPRTATPRTATPNGAPKASPTFPAAGGAPSTAAHAAAAAAAAVKQEEATAAAMLAAAGEVAGNDAVASWFSGVLEGWEAVEGGAVLGAALQQQRAAAALADSERQGDDSRQGVPEGVGGGSGAASLGAGQGHGQSQPAVEEPLPPAPRLPSVVLMAQAAALIKGLHDELQKEKARSAALSQQFGVSQARAAQAEGDVKAAQAATEEARRMFAMLLQAAGNLPIPMLPGLRPHLPAQPGPAGMPPGAAFGAPSHLPPSPLHLPQLPQQQYQHQQQQALARPPPSPASPLRQQPGGGPPPMYPARGRGTPPAGGMVAVQQQHYQQQQQLGVGPYNPTQHGTPKAAAAASPVPMLAPHRVPQQPRQQEHPQQQAIMPVLPPGAMLPTSWQPLQQQQQQQQQQHPTAAPLQQAQPHAVALPNLLITRDIALPEST
ncbi:hypothetical protein N2152v2_007169 [Parachlorella kessleri]